MLVIEGRLVPMADDGSATFKGRVWIGDDGMIAGVTRGRAGGPGGFDGATLVDVGDALVLPGLIDLHNHLAYNTLPLWTEPTRTTPYLHHNSWPGAPSYAASITWPAYAFITAAPDELLAYAETRAIVGGTTSVQGSPPKNKPRDGFLVRNIEDETWGGGDPNLVYASTLTMKPAALAERANSMRQGRGFIYHCGEGQPGSIVAGEYRDAAAAGCLQERFVAVHCNSVDPGAYRQWTDRGAIAWSPLSNLWLYGTTTDVPAARRAGLTVCLGADWGPSGSKSVLGELKVARVASDHLGWDLSDEDIVRMATANPGDVLARAWGRQTGRLRPGAVGDVTVIAARARVEPYRTVLRATERDIALVVVGGSARYGTRTLMAAAGAGPVTAVPVAGQSRALALRRPDDPTKGWTWTAVLDRLEQVRADPKGQIDQGLGRLAAWSGALDEPGAPLRLALDMPTGLAPIGGLPKDLTKIQIPPLNSLVHDASFVDSLAGRGFHAGVLDALAGYYS